MHVWVETLLGVLERKQTETERWIPLTLRKRSCLLVAKVIVMDGVFLGGKLMAFSTIMSRFMDKKEGGGGD